MVASTVCRIFIWRAPGFRCSVAIRTRECIVGAAPAAVLRVALEWARKNEAMLIATWRELNDAR